MKHILVSDRGDDTYSQQGAGADESVPDRTHKAQLGSKVHFDATFAGVKSHSSVSVPSDPWLPIKTVTVHCVIFRNHRTPPGEPPNDNDVPCRIPWVREDIEKRVNERFAQAGILVKLDDHPEYVDPPTGVDLNNGLAPAPSSETTKIWQWAAPWKNGQPSKTIWIYYFNQFEAGGAGEFTLGGLTVGSSIFIQVNGHRDYMTAHELGHALEAIGPDPDHEIPKPPAPQWSYLSHVMFFMPNMGIDQVVQNKRFTRQQIIKMRNSPFAQTGK